MGASATKHGMKRLGSSPIRSDSDSLKTLNQYMNHESRSQVTQILLAQPFCSIVANIFIHHHATAGY